MSTAPIPVLFSVSDTGGGHRSAAIALDVALQQVSEVAIDGEIVDILHVTDIPGLRSASTIYNHLSTHWLPFYNAGFRATNYRWQTDAFSWLTYFSAERHILRTLADTNPRLVVVTHPLTQRYLGIARRIHRLSFRLVTVVTDLVTLHASWTYPDVDLCVVTTDEAFSLMQQRGMPTERMVQTGFPVHPKFANYNQSQRAARRELGLTLDCPTVLVTGGGVGSGRVQDLVPVLERECPDKQLLVVTGNNRALHDELHEETRGSRTHIYGFVNNMETMMAASDMVITKAGPGTLMEALVMRRPVIITAAVGMQEHGNIDFVTQRELGFFCPTPEEVVAAVRDLSDSNTYVPTVERLVGAVPRDGAEQIAALLLDQLDQSGLPPSSRWRRLRIPLRRVWRRRRKVVNTPAIA